MGIFKTAEPLTLQAISAEVVKARTKFPGNQHLLAALTEEVGELAEALLKAKSRDEIEREAIQVCAVAVRIIEEGDASFKSWPGEQPVNESTCEECRKPLTGAPACAKLHFDCENPTHPLWLAHDGAGGHIVVTPSATFDRDLKRTPHAL